MHTHEFTYETKEDFIQQLQVILDKLYVMEPLVVVRARYPHLKSTAFTMRLKRFGGAFECKRDGRGITELRMTYDLHRYLSHPLNHGTWELARLSKAASESKDKQDYEHDTKATEGIIAPAGRVRPRGERTD